MFRTNIGGIVIVCLALQLSCQFVHAEHRILPEYLVKAVVKTSKEIDPNISSHMLQITHVYRGPNKLMGQSFVVESRKKPHENDSWPERKVFPLLRNGEEGIWFAKNTKTGVKVYRVSKIIPFNSRKGITPDYEENEEVANSIELLEHATPVAKGNLLITYLVDKNPKLAELAIRILSVEIPNGTTEIIDKLENGKLQTSWAEIVADEVVSTSENKWVNSGSQKALYKKWVTQKHSKNLFRLRAIIRITHAFSDKIIDRNAFTDLLGLAISNKDFPLLSKVDCVRRTTIRINSATASEKDRLFSLLLHLVRKDPSDRIRSEAAWSLKGISYKNKAWETELIKLIKELDNPDLKDVIKDALEVTQGPVPPT